MFPHSADVMITFHVEEVGVHLHFAADDDALGKQVYQVVKEIPSSILRIVNVGAHHAPVSRHDHARRE